MTRGELTNKNANNKVDVMYKIWLGIMNLFQTFEDLESVKGKQVDIQAVRQILAKERDA